jgi:outer membrane protein assembly factor BamB
MNYRYLFFLALLPFLSCTHETKQKKEFAQWRGNDRSGMYNEKNLLTSWPANGPTLLWSNETIGSGYGAPAVTSDRIFITGEKDSNAVLFAFDLKGKLIWKTNYGKEWVVSYPGSRSTPTVIDSLLYITSGLGNLYCFNSETGKQIWSVDMIKDLHGKFTMFGHSESPLVVDDKVFLTPGGNDTNVVAFNRFTGKTIWISKGRGERPAYNSPTIIKRGQFNILVTFTAYSLMGIDLQTGNLLWFHEQDNVPVAERKLGMGDTHSNTIYYENGSIYYFEGDGNCAVKLELSEDGKSIKQIWRNKGTDNYMGGFIKIGETIYSCGFSRKNLIAVDAKTGQFTDSLKCGAGTIISAENLLYYYNLKGEMNLVKPDPKKMELISSFKISKGSQEHFSHPVIANGVLYIRHGNALMAYDIKKK